MEDRFNESEREVKNAENKTPYLGKVQHMLGYVPKADALGDDVKNALNEENPYFVLTNL